MSITSLSFDQFVRSIAISKNETFGMLVGAGASLTSGIPSATDCIWSWKQSVFSTKSHQSLNGLDYRTDSVKTLIQNWIDSEGTFPVSGAEDEYSFYAEYCYPLEGDRAKFFRSICADKQPSIGYRILAHLNKFGSLHAVWTTNFDGLVSKAAVVGNCEPIEIALDSVERVFRPHNPSELPIIKLHGDYRYGPLKNTAQELQHQDETFRFSLNRYLTSNHLLVIGYSGRDESVMSALTDAYSQQGGGRLYWCGYGHDIPASVAKLIDTAKSYGRDAVYVPTDGFDKTMLSIGQALASHGDSKVALDQMLAANSEDNPTTPFTMDVPYLSTIVKSNLFKIRFPQEVFQFEYEFAERSHFWRSLRHLCKNRPVVAVPKEKLVWALGTLTEVNDIFGSGLRGSISRVPISSTGVQRDSVLHHLLLACLTKSLAARCGLPNDGRSKIWLSQPVSTKMLNETIFSTHQAVQLAFCFDGQNNYLSINPDFQVVPERLDIEVTKEIKQEIGRTYFDKLRNKQYSEYLNEWRGRLVDSSQAVFSIDFPLHSGSGFQFSIARTPAFGKVMNSNSQRSANVDKSIESHLVFSGIRYQEPPLVFSSAHAGMSQAPTDFHPMRGLIKNRPFDHDMVGTLYGPTVRLGIISPKLEAGKFSSHLNRINTKISSGGINKAYLIDFPGFHEAFGVSITIPQPGTHDWVTCDDPNLQLSSQRQVTLDLRNKIIQQIDHIASDGVKKVIVLCIPERWNHFCAYNESKEEFDLHNYVKAYCAERSIASQFIQEKTVDDTLLQCQINWWHSLSYFVKSLRTPWVLNTLSTDTAFAGIGYSVSGKKDDTNIVLGCSHIYNSQGQGLKYRLSKVDDQLVWDRLDRPHLSYQDAFKLGLSILELFYSTMSGLPKRVVVHKRNFFMNDEINGLRDSLGKNGIEHLDLVEINVEDDMRFLAGSIGQEGKPDINMYPVGRGTCILLNGREALLWTHGNVQSVQNPNYSYYLGGRSIPAPLRVIKHFGTGNIGQIANEILGLTKVNWNSFDLYSALPATISSSNQIAKIGKLLSRREGCNYDYRFFI